MAHNTLILLPAFNEAATLPLVLQAVKSAAPDCDILVINDGSRDRTAECAIEGGATVCTHRFNMGYGVALQTGYKYALRHGYRFAVQMDADGQHEAEDIGRLLDRVQGDSCDLCIGSRFLEGTPYAIPFSRKVGMYFFRRIASIILGQTITDPTSGFQAMNRHVIEFFARDSYPVDYPDTDVLVMLHRHGFRVSEAPVRMRAGIPGHTMHGGMRPLYYLFRMSLDIPMNLVRKER
ncbi:MAG: glycosyl transferase family 2 [Candidatus Hydrogenedentota bacterium]